MGEVDEVTSGSVVVGEEVRGEKRVGGEGGKGQEGGKEGGHLRLG